MSSMLVFWFKMLTWEGLAGLARAAAAGEGYYMRAFIITATELFTLVPSCWIDSILLGSCCELPRMPA